MTGDFDGHNVNRAMDLQCLDHVHFSVPDLARAKHILGPFLRGQFVECAG
jgi:hypothetical protein